MDSAGFIRGLAKADFADALGVVIRPQTVTIAHLTKRLRTVKVAELRTEALEVPAEARPAEVARALRRFAGDRALEELSVAVVADPADTFWGNLFLPVSAAGNASEIVGYELDRLFPVPSDRLLIDHFTRPLGTVGERVAITVLAALRDPTLALTSGLSDAGICVGAITTEPSALADYHHFCSGGSGAIAAIFGSSGGREYLTLCCDGLMVSSHHCSSGEAEDGGRAAVVRRELEALLPERAEDHAMLLVAEPAEADETALAAIAPEGFAPGAAAIGYEEAVAIGAALGQLGESRARVNLLPAEMVRTTRGLGLRELVLSAAVLVMALVLMGSIALKNIGIRNALAAELDRLAPMVEEVVDTEDANRALLEKTLKLERSSRSDVLTYLREVTRLVPKTAYLTTFRYKEDRIELDGIADNASTLIGILEASPYFQRVEFTAPTTKYLQTQERFSLRMRLE